MRWIALVRRVVTGIAICAGVLCLYCGLMSDSGKGSVTWGRLQLKQTIPFRPSLFQGSSDHRNSSSIGGSDVRPDDLKLKGVSGLSDVATTGGNGSHVALNSSKDNQLIYNGTSKRHMTGILDIDQSQPDLEDLYRHLVVVTAFSQNHFKEALGMISTVQKTMPQTRIVVYDIGIKASFKPQVKALCNVELRPFKFDRYPRFVSNLRTYSWKIIIIKETVNEFGAIFWADASVRFKRSLKEMLPFALQHHGYLARIHSYRARTKNPVRHNFYYTHELMYKAIGVDKTAYSKSPYAPHLTANRQLIINSSTVQQNYLRPMYACALDESCISPPGSKFGQHRYDASALMLVIHKYFPGEFSRQNDHLKDWEQVMYMHRLSDDWEKANSC